MKEHPKLFNGDMVRAILEGRKTQTRRVSKTKCKPGDHLWVRENWRSSLSFDDTKPSDLPHTAIYYEADGKKSFDDFAVGRKIRPSIFMPRWASRITLEVTGVRVERLQDITEEDAKAEGVGPHSDKRNGEPHVAAFADLWNSLNDKRGFGWNENPWVCVIEFQTIKAPALHAHDNFV